MGTHSKSRKYERSEKRPNGCVNIRPEAEVKPGPSVALSGLLLRMINGTDLVLALGVDILTGRDGGFDIGVGARDHGLLVGVGAHDLRVVGVAVGRHGVNCGTARNVVVLRLNRVQVGVPSVIGR